MTTDLERRSRGRDGPGRHAVAARARFVLAKPPVFRPVDDFVSATKGLEQELLLRMSASDLAEVCASVRRRSRSSPARPSRVRSRRASRPRWWSPHEIAWSRQASAGGVFRADLPSLHQFAIRLASKSARRSKTSSRSAPGFAQGLGLGNNTLRRADHERAGGDHTVGSRDGRAAEDFGRSGRFGRSSTDLWRGSKP